MKSFLVFAAVAVVFVGALPVFDELEFLDMPHASFIEEEPMEEDMFRQRRSLSEADFEEMPFEEIPEQGLRLKRATCDATSFTSKWLTINHSACAIHCLTKGYKGGKCKNTICHCRN